MDQINFTRDYMNDAIRGMSVTWRNRDMERLLDQNTIDHLGSIAIQTPRKHQLIEGFYFEPHNKVDAGLIYIV